MGRGVDLDTTTKRTALTRYDLLPFIHTKEQLKTMVSLANITPLPTSDILFEHELMSYLPLLFWRRLCSSHMSRHHSDILMPRLHKPGTLWPLRTVASVASWKDTHTHTQTSFKFTSFKSTKNFQKSTTNPGQTVPFLTVLQPDTHCETVLGFTTHSTVAAHCG